ncbi:AMH_1a_G0038970.mRNA.1.CDS.1 [Saccharomyces cerevisiae]|nr:EM14S01-3B_G0040720.mRNA.1.CDS.1 [Saccharomyces cerevisiae]CAI4713537.1 AMH_1a_G0038970.mRNA.1.CDS.1 [Saccharomyces cerevisiae]CAI6849559.1 AMH_1a_G0038970.mRNA.1.CDS.1 [Saccharomyces cerevisiae]
MIKNGTCPFWERDDLSECARREYIEFKFPLFILLTGMIYAFCKVFRAFYLRRKNHTNEAPEFEEQGNGNHGYARFSVLRLKSAWESRSFCNVNNRSTFDKFKKFIEGAFIVLQLTIHLYILPNMPMDNKKFFHQGFLVQMFLWILLLVVITLRLISASQSFRWVLACKRDLWAVSFYSYASLFTLSILPLRSVFIGKIKDKIMVKYIISETFIDLALLLLLSTSSIEGTRYSFLVENENKKLPPTPTVFGLLTFSRIDRLIWKAYKHCLGNADIWDLDINNKSIAILANFEMSSKKGRLLPNIICYFKAVFISQLFLAFVSSFLNFVPSLLMPRILSYVNDPKSQSWNLVSLYVSSMLVSKIIATTCRGQGLFLGEKGAMQLRTVLISNIYSKTLRRTILKDSTTSLQKNASTSFEENPDSSEAEPRKKPSRKDNSVNNVMSIDAFKVSEAMNTFYLACEAVFMTITALMILYSLLGWSAFAGTFALLAMIPLNFWCATFYGNYQADQLILTDKRTSWISEALNSIRLIKLLAWENLFYQKIINVRDGEIRLLKKKATIFFLNHLIWFFGPTLVSAITFSVFIKFKNQTLTPTIAFTALSLFAILRTPMDQIASTVSLLIQSFISLERIQDYLNEPETRKYEILEQSNTKFGFEDASMEWEAAETSFKLKNISIEFKLNSLNAIIGPTGSGKSSLLLGLLGELNLLSGKIYVPTVESRDDLEIGKDGMTNSMAYCSQTPWLISGTIKDNVVFGEIFNKQKFDNVMKSCCLDKDIKAMTAGIRTDVGDGGFSLSGGQQQRIALARAIYSSSRYLILDDCLSAVDPETALYIYEECLCGPMMKGRTCIITSHNISLVTKRADWLVILDRGEMKSQGKPSDLIKSNEFLRESINSDSKNTTHNQIDLKRSTTSKKTKNGDPEGENLQDDVCAEVENFEETKMEGSVKFSAYKWLADYFGGLGVVFVFTSSSILIHGITLSQGFWLRYWLETGSSGSKSTWFYRIVEGHSNIYFFPTYIIIGFVSSFLTSGKVWIAIISGTNVTKKIFAKLLSSILYAKLRFHNVTPTGRIMNRFSKDMDIIDQQLIPNFEGLSYSVVVCLWIILLIGYVTPQFLLFAIPLCALYYTVCTLYLRASRELKRIDNINISPIHQLFAEAIKGVTTIRALADERRFITQSLVAIDRSNAPFFYLNMATEWITYRVDIIGTLVLFSSSVMIIMKASYLDAGLAGILLSNAFSFTETAQWIIKVFSSVELLMSSVERIKEYTDIPSESNGYISPPANWPQTGDVELKNLSLRYSPHSSKALDNVSFKVKAGTKVGIVGRTGAGKSSIIAAIYRLSDWEDGTIIIDNKDIKHIPLERLRNSISCIPQDPTLFDGTVRSNLDPFDRYSDVQIYGVLSKVGLIEECAELSLISEQEQPNFSSHKPRNRFIDLNTVVKSGGSNLSQGQRQLLCLARSMLGARNIMLIDEATASIDYTSDAKIQKTIRETMKNTTILTIAHRLRSVIDYDKILVMEMGRVKEYDHPYTLISDRNTIFYRLCKKSGEFENLFELAKVSFDNKR